MGPRRSAQTLTLEDLFSNITSDYDEIKRINATLHSSRNYKDQMEQID